MWKGRHKLARNHVTRFHLLPYLRHADRLLFHCFEQARLILLFDGIKVVEAANASVRQNQHTRLETPLTRILTISGHRDGRRIGFSNGRFRTNGEKTELANAQLGS